MSKHRNLVLSVLPFEHVESHLAREVIADRLANAISKGLIAAGTPIRQQALADYYAVSRMPVREALRLLESQGLVLHVQNKGVIVAALPSAKQLEARTARAVGPKRTMAVRRKSQPGRASRTQVAQLDPASRLNEFRSVLLKSYAQRNADLINLVADMRQALLGVPWGQNDVLDNLIERADTLLIGR